MRIKLAWAWQLSCNFGGVIKIIVFDSLFLSGILRWGSFCRLYALVFSQIKFGNSWRFMVFVIAINFIKIGLSFEIGIDYYLLN